MTRFGRFNPLPRGARDLLPVGHRRRRALTGRLLDRMDAWGYQTVSTPLIEYADTLALGLDDAERDRCIRFTEAGTGAVVALRSDVTPQIARLVAQHSDDDETRDVVRLCYAADIVAIPREDDDGIERHQVGVELIGDASAFADAELVSLCDEALQSAGASGYRFDLAHTGILRRVLASVPSAVRSQARQMLARKDRCGLSRLAGAEALAPLADAFGEARPAIARARRDLAAFDVGAELDRLVAVVDALSDDTRASVDVDLGEVRGHDYYTGLRMRVWAPGSSRPIVRGGRYDDLLGRYGPARPATGFAIDLDALELSLPRQLNEAAGRGVLIAVVGEGATQRRRAEIEADAIRRSPGGRAWIEVVGDVEHAQRRALERGAERTVVLDADTRHERVRADGTWQRATRREA